MGALGPPGRPLALAAGTVPASAAGGTAAGTTSTLSDSGVDIQPREHQD
jgi:hypothetical protein